MTIKETPNKITAVLKVTATAEFFDDEASEETVRYAIEQDLEDAGFDVDVELLKEQEHSGTWEWITEDKYRCSECKNITYVDECMNEPQYLYCPYCGRKMTFEGILVK